MNPTSDSGATGPIVSICLPNLNNREYLPERIASIRRQTYGDWELIAIDNFSDDGAWEYLTAVARQETRMRVAQAPREGMYANWNNCLREVRGRYVYIATSDDNMADDFLERMVAALENNPDCDIAHSPLRTFDSDGRELPDTWSNGSMFGCSSGALLPLSHKRLAPHDGLLHLAGRSVYTSITQLLIRRGVFQRVGEFSNRWGSPGDFHWNMRASLCCNTVHVPETWGGWRQHPAQATQQAGLRSPAHQLRVREMIEDALREAEAELPPDLRRILKDRWQPWFDAKLRFEDALVFRKGAVARLGFLARSLTGRDRHAAWDFALGRLLGSRAKIDTRRLLQFWQDGGMPPMLVGIPLPHPGASP